MLLSIPLSVCPSVAYIANNSRTQKPSVPRFGRKVSHLRCDSHTSFKIKWSKVSVRGGRGHTMSAEPGGHTACIFLYCIFSVFFSVVTFYALFFLACIFSSMSTEVSAILHVLYCDWRTVKLMTMLMLIMILRE